MKLVSKTIFLLLMPVLGHAQAGANESGRIFRFLEHINSAISAAVANGIHVSNMFVYINASMITFAIIYSVRSLLEYGSNKIHFNDLLYVKFMFILLVFSLTDIVFYTYIFNTLETTSNDLGSSIQFIFTGFPNFYQLPGGMLFYFLNVSPMTPEIEILNMVFIAIIIVLAAIILWKRVLEAAIAVSFFYFFAFVGFKIVYVMGFVILPLVFITEFRFIVFGYFRSVAFIVFFSIVWKLLLGLCAFLIFTALFGASFLNSLIHGGYSMHDFYLDVNASLADGRGIPIIIDSPLDVVIPVICLSVAVSLLSASFAITQFLLTGFLSMKANFVGNQ